MKKLFFLILLLAILTAGCASNTEPVDGSNTTASSASTDSTASKDKASASKTLEGEIKFYPTYDANYKTASNEIFDFWFDIPNDWKSVDQSEDGSTYTILPGDDNIAIEMYGAIMDGPEEDFYTGLSGSNGTISDFTYRDGWLGKKISVSDSETYYVRIDGDSYMVLHIDANGNDEWMTQNAEKLNYVAMSARATRESYGNNMGDENSITLDDLRLGKIELDMGYNELIKVMQKKPYKEVKDEYEGLDAKTLFFADDTQIYIVDNAVYSINVTSQEYQTPRGLKTGDTEEKLKELYGEPSRIEDGVWGYNYNGYELFTAIIEDGIVTEIQIDLGM